MSATAVSSHPRAVHPAFLTWADAPLLQIPSLAAAHLLSFNAIEGNQIQDAPRNGNMRLTRPSSSWRAGLLRIEEEARILELDARAQDEGQRNGSGGQPEADGNGTVCVLRNRLDEILSEMVIVVPCKDEELSVIRGVVSAIPARCLVVLVSNCQRKNDDDQYLQQVAMVKAFGGYGRQMLAIHQKDRTAAAAFQASGMSDLLDPVDGTIRNGKGEGMLLGIALASAFCPRQRYIGFVDADNLHAGSVHEYCKAFAAGFATAQSPAREDTMVRLRWSSKPKMRNNGRWDFVTEGRCSRIVNSWLNKLFVPTAAAQPHGSHKGQADVNKNSSFVTTGNAGEHAMTLHLALKLRMAAGYAIEPFHFIDLLERHLKGSKGGQHAGAAHSTGGAPHSTAAPLERPVRVVQVRTLSAHFHRASGDEHIRRMWACGLGSVYHGLAPYRSMPGSDDGSISKLREEMHAFAVEDGGIDGTTGELPQPKVYPALESIDMAKFRSVLESNLEIGTLRAFGLAASCGHWQI